MKSWRKTILGALVVLSGVSAAIITVFARQSGDWELTRLGAIASLLFAVLIIIFVVPPLARSARAEAARLNPAFQVTAGGLVFVSVYAVVAFAAWNTGNNLLFLVFSVMTSTLFVAWTAARSALRDLVVSARFPDHIFAGDPAPVIVTVNNTKRLLPSFSIVVEARSRLEETGTRRRFMRRRAREQKRVLAYFMYVPRRAKVEQRVEQTFERRGRVTVTGFEISTRFPLGLFRLRRRLRARDVEIVVYPKPERVGDELHLLPADAGRLESPRHGAGYDLHSLREYQPHDDVRRIDWKATARARRLIVREFNAEDERRVHVALDTFVETGVGTRKDNPADKTGAAGGSIGEGKGDDAGGSEKAGQTADAAERFESAVERAASLVAHFIEERAEVRLTAGDEESRYGVGREHLYECLRRLALVVPRSAAHDSTRRLEFWQRLAPHSSDGGHVILITTAPRGTIPAELWRKSHVIHL
jgi:uncharacterized protein (DUF58 family)